MIKEIMAIVGTTLVIEMTTKDIRQEDLSYS